ncbi:MAG: CopG family transcriptional regulator [Candidatus Neomarinimicrobiota bacterium]|nr:MAG: CopG family transcriptional regulator [Candidatus Neomarinimicrobiota bacterium]
MRYTKLVMVTEHKEMKRITVSLDEETAKMLEELVSLDKRSVSEIVRFAVSDYYKTRSSKSINPEFIDVIIDLLSEREHVIVDVSLWTAILEELNEVAKEDFWKFVGKVGKEYAIQLKVKGLRRVYDILKYMESSNWYRVKPSSTNTYILVLTVKAEVKILSIFLQNLFEALEIPVEIIEGVRKLIIIEKMLDSKSEIVRRYLD